MGLGRNTSPADTAAYLFLQPQVDVDALVQIERAQVSASYFKSLTSAIQAARLFDNDLVVSYLGVMKYPDLGAEIADLFLRLQGIKWVICIGVYENDLILSVRSRSQRIRAGDLARRIIGTKGTAGGHGTMAGGQIRFLQQDPVQLSNQLVKSALQYLKANDALDGKPLI